MPRQRVEFGLAGTVVPDQAVSFGSDRLGLVDAESIDQLPVVIELVVDVSPVGVARAEGRAKGGVLATGARQDGEESAAMLMDVGHIFGGGELAVGDVEEVVAAGQLAEKFPGTLMGAVVGGIAALDPELHGHGAVA